MPAEEKAPATAKDHRQGHRERLRKRFRDHGLEEFEDYEALELLLLYVARQQDMKPVAKTLIQRFGSFKNVLDASEEDLAAVEGVGPAAATLLHFAKQAATRYLQQASRARIALGDVEALIHYCIMSLGAQPNERFRVICLDSNFAVVDERDVAEGTVNQAAVHPRKVIEAALQAKASTLVFVHKPGARRSASKRGRSGAISRFRSNGSTAAAPSPTRSLWTS